MAKRTREDIEKDDRTRLEKAQQEIEDRIDEKEAEKTGLDAKKEEEIERTDKTVEAMKAQYYAHVWKRRAMKVSKKFAVQYHKMPKETAMDKTQRLKALREHRVERLENDLTTAEKAFLKAIEDHMMTAEERPVHTRIDAIETEIDQLYAKIEQLLDDYCFSGVPKEEVKKVFEFLDSLSEKTKMKSNETEEDDEE